MHALIQAVGVYVVLNSAIDAQKMKHKLQKLKKFEVQNAQCRDDEDREAIITLIADW